MQLMKNEAALKEFVARLGWLGPAFLIAVNILQIVFAPLPGYGVYLVAGFLYGAWMGGVWGSIGMMIGGMLAMFLGRSLGRPMVQRVIGAKTLDRWEDATRSESSLVWWALFVSPIGDAPFLMAGLARVSYRKIFAISAITRIPAAFIAAAIGSGALHLSTSQLTLIVIALAIPLIILYRYQERLLMRMELWLAQRTGSEAI